MLAGKMKLRNFLFIVVVVVGGGITAASYLACGKSSEPAHKKETVAMPAPADAPPPPPPVDAGVAVAAPTSDLLPRPYDAEALAWRTKSITGGKAKDVAKGRPFKIDAYEDAGSPTVNRVKVDANRNNKWDDKITFKPNEIVLERAPADDEKYTETYTWNGAGWTKKK
jgi:hypothetical protein